MDDKRNTCDKEISREYDDVISIPISCSSHGLDKTNLKFSFYNLQFTLPIVAVSPFSLGAGEGNQVIGNMCNVNIMCSCQLG